MNTSQTKAALDAGVYDKRLTELYSEEKLPEQKERYKAAVESFEELYGSCEISVFSVAGRSEISGNHTDHNKG